MKRCLIRDESGSLIKTRVEGELSVGNVIRCAYLRKDQKQTIIDVNKYLLMTRSYSGYTRTLILVNK